MPDPVVLAVDPGSTGGAAVIFDRDAAGLPNLRFAAAWRAAVKDGAGIYRLSYLWPGLQGPYRACEVVIPRSAYRLGSAIDVVLRMGRITSWRLIVEDAYMGANPRGALVIARWSGAFAGGVENGAKGEPEWIAAGEWRQRVFGLRRNTNRADAAELVGAAMPPALLVPLAPLGSGAREHLLSALGIGLWGLGYRVERTPEGRLWTSEASKSSASSARGATSGRRGSNAAPTPESGAGRGKRRG